MEKVLTAKTNVPVQDVPNLSITQFQIVLETVDLQTD